MTSPRMGSLPNLGWPMQKWFLISALALAGVAFNSNRASAWWFISNPPPSSSASFPMLTPSGYFSNTYYFAWYYPWYANYNYSDGWYANWWMGGGYASYPGQQMAPPPAPAPLKEAPKKKEPAKVSIALPADAALAFNGAAARGTGVSRTFVTPDLEAGRDYEYVLTADVTRDGEVLTATARVIVRAGETTTVTLAPSAAARK